MDAFKRSLHFCGRGLERIGLKNGTDALDTGQGHGTASPHASSRNETHSPPLPVDLEAQVHVACGTLPPEVTTANDAVEPPGTALTPSRLHSPAPPTPNPGSGLMNLPPELQLMVVRNLEFGEIEKLRRTCRYYRTFISHATLQDLIKPNVKSTLLAHCYICLCYDPSRSTLLWSDWTNPRYPFSSKCIDCAYARDDFKIGRKVAMGNYGSVWICRWCGYPICQDAASNQPEFHQSCHDTYNSILVFFFCLGWVQFSIGVVAGALCWTYFKDERMVLIPSIINFILLFWLLALITIRGENVRTYHLAAVLEFIVMGLWVLPLTVTIEHVKAGESHKSLLATLSFIVLNILFRLLNVVGNIILFYEYRHWRRKNPQSSMAQRLLTWPITGLIYWTYPQAVEQEYPPRYYRLKFWKGTKVRS